MEIECTILGYWGAYPINHEGTSAYLVSSGDYHLLMDGGSASLITLEDYLDPLQLDAVILSHYHHDHIADIGVLQFMWQLKESSKKVNLLPIYGHNEDPENFAKMTMPGVTEGIAYQPEKELELGPFSIRFLKTVHPVPCYAMRIEEKATSQVLVYTADSGFLSDLVAFSENADVLLADTYFFDGQEHSKIHMTAGEVGELAQKAQVKKVVLTHLPQKGDLSLLLQQAKNKTDAQVEILLAKKDLQIMP